MLQRITAAFGLVIACQCPSRYRCIIVRPVYHVYTPDISCFVVIVCNIGYL